MADPHLLATPGAELTALQRAPVRAAPASGKISLALLANALRLADAAIVYLAGLAIYTTYLTHDGAPVWADYQLAIVIATAIALNLFSIADIYDERRLSTGRTGLLRLLGCWGAIWLGMLTTAVLFKAAQDYSRVWYVGWGLGVCAGLLLGCASMRVPEYQRPEAPTKSTWSQPPAGTVSPTQAISPQWWAEFGDPELDSLVAQAIAGNIDLKVLSARIDVAHAQIAEARAGSQPSADVAAGSSFQKTSGQPLAKEFSAGTQVS